MSADLTPFDDGVGYREHAWNGLSAAQVLALSSSTGLAGARKPTVDRLRYLELVTPVETGRFLTARGRELVAWARATGRAGS